MSNTKVVKHKLTRFFVVVVFLLILVFGIGFLWVKFFAEKNKEVNEVVHFTEIVETRKISAEQLEKFVSMNERFWPRERNKNEKQPEKREPGIGQIEYLVLSDTKDILDSHILNYKNEEFFYDLAEHFNNNNTLYMYEGYVVKNLHTNSGNFILFKKMNYDLENFFTDALRFLLLDLLFCIVIYFIGRRVVEKIFIPVEENMDDMKNFVHNAGHELKTPITVMDSNLQLLMSMKSYDEELVGEMKTELKNMNGLIDTLVNLSDISSFTNTQKNNLLEKVQEIVKHFSTDMEQKNITATIDIPSDIEIEANSNYFSIFLTNIIKNAVKYNRQNGEIHITFKDKTLNIRDTGIGIDEKNLEKIWDRFYREQQARNKEGYGIGLSLVQKIATIYNWKLTMKSKKWEGSDFGVRF